MGLGTTMTTYGDNDYLSVQEAAKHVGVSDETIRTWIKERGLPASRRSARRTRIRFGQLVAWLDEQNHLDD